MPTASGLDSTSWAALALALTLVGGVLTVLVWRRRGIAAGLHGAAWTLVPLALWLTGTLRLAVRIAGDVGSWAVHLAFSPVTWLGVVVAGTSAALFVVSGFLRRRGRGRPKAVRRSAPTKPERRRGGDEDMDEIEAILKRHGI